jgi:hypothetical protein
MVDLELRVEIQRLAEKIARDCDRASIRDSLMSAAWYRYNTWLGMASALMAGAAAAVAGLNLKGISFPDYLQPFVSLIVALLASCSAMLASVVTFLAPAEKASVYHEYSNRYWALRDRIRKFANLDCRSIEDDERLKLLFENLLNERIELDRKHPLVPEWVYGLAGAKLKEKEIRNNGTAAGASGATQSAATGADEHSPTASPEHSSDQLVLVRVHGKAAESN